MDQTTPTPYQAPHAAILGDAPSVVRAISDGDNLDADFPVGTPKVDLTFS